MKRKGHYLDLTEEAIVAAATAYVETQMTPAQAAAHVKAYGDTRPSRLLGLAIYDTASEKAARAAEEGNC